MAEQVEQLQFDGQEVQKMDYNLLSLLAGLADDRVLAELLRIQPFDGATVYKAILPFSMRSPKTALAGVTTNNATVTSSLNADGSVHIRPFRAVIGSRNTYFNNVPAGDVDAPPANGGVSPDTASVASWRNIRSGIYVGTSSSALQGSLTLAPNSSGNARWDLIYATVAVDAQGPSVTRRVKDPNSSALTTPNVPQYLYSPVTVNVVTGTPGSPAVRPSLPADASGNYNIALAYVRVPNGFNGTTQINQRDIVATASTGSLFQRPSPVVRVCSGNNDANNGAAGSSVFTTSGNPFYYDPTVASARPGPFMPPDWLGMEKFVGEIDATNASNANWSHQNGGVVDDTIDWRGRLVLCFCSIASAGSALKFPNDPSASGVRPVVFPVPGGPTGTALFQMGQTMLNDDLEVVGDSTVLYVTNAINSAVQAGSTSGLCVDPGTGKLLFYNNGTSPLAKFLFWIFATGPMPNL